jgi:16S rRNA processing protein RimM
MGLPPSPKSSPPVPSGLDAAGGEIELGKVVGVFGFRGELRVHLHSHHDSALLGAELPVVLVGPGGERRSARLACRTGAGRRILGRIADVTDERSAQALMGWRIVARRGVLPEPAEGEFYVADLQGLRVVADGVERGRVVDVVSTPAGDLLELAVDGDTVFVPFAGAAVLAVDVAGGCVVVDADALVEP